ncbi:hypothetical protein MKJ01_13575 [Chryseobacterium sp. SSA4.19]|uniref:hypothetical protein n=1 Tax=Chryseobacterium sp. SSA4.19 TaxID=2919915 RepID=UPI001F4D3FAD|nr:hypothetical protein [Chryseobacterium sp. SSA4.19]MCJ8154796.1 hypothetical protein [Chryseobacterium sp. SSA4.19]
MKNILIILFFLITYSNSFAQKKSDFSNLTGIWTGKIDENQVKFEVLENNPKSFTFSFINFQNEKFIIKKSDITTNEKNEIVIKIKEAKFSSERWEKCVFSTGIITISNLSQSRMTLNLKSVGPTCWIMDDVSINMDDMDNTELIKRNK